MYGTLINGIKKPAPRAILIGGAVEKFGYEAEEAVEAVLEEATHG